MIKATLKYLLLLSVILLSAYSQLFAHTDKGLTFHSLSNTPLGEDIIQIASSQTTQPSLISDSSSGTTKQNHKSIVPAKFEIEEDELVAFKKFLESNKSITALFYAFIAGFLFRYILKGFSLSEFFYHFSSYRRHIVLQVFRI